MTDSDQTATAQPPTPGAVDPGSQVAAASQAIAGVGDGPLDEAVIRLDALHRELQAALAELDQR